MSDKSVSQHDTVHQRSVLIGSDHTAPRAVAKSGAAIKIAATHGKVALRRLAEACLRRLRFVLMQIYLPLSMDFAITVPQHLHTGRFRLGGWDAVAD